jgi:hypothetical protein
MYKHRPEDSASDVTEQDVEVAPPQAAEVRTQDQLERSPRHSRTERVLVDYLRVPADVPVVPQRSGAEVAP